MVNFFKAKACILECAEMLNDYVTDGKNMTLLPYFFVYFFRFWVRWNLVLMKKALERLIVTLGCQKYQILWLL